MSFASSRWQSAIGESRYGRPGGQFQCSDSGLLGMMFPTLRAFSHPFSIHHMSSREQRKTTLLFRISERKEFRGGKMRPTGEGQSQFPHSNCCDIPSTLTTQELAPDWPDCL